VAGDSTAERLAAEVAADADADAEAPPPALLLPCARHTGVVLLGTGSAEPSKYRGPSGILLRVCAAAPAAMPAAQLASAGQSGPVSGGGDCSGGAGGSGSHGAWMLLDCGEGTWGQVNRLLGPEGAAEVVGGRATGAEAFEARACGALNWPP
jgi:hypothetical protein